MSIWRCSCYATCFAFTTTARFRPLAARGPSLCCHKVLQELHPGSFPPSDRSSASTHRLIDQQILFCEGNPMKQCYHHEPSIGNMPLGESMRGRGPAGIQNKDSFKVQRSPSTNRPLPEGCTSSALARNG